MAKKEFDVLSPNLKSNELFSGAQNGSAYKIPKYQRSYVWGKKQWDNLFNDILDNKVGYFIGSILCVEADQSNLLEVYDEYEVIDGQQRLTTLSLFLAAIYKVLETRYDVSKFDDIQKAEFTQIEIQLYALTDNEDKQPRVFPQKTDNNLNDYLYIMGGGNEPSDDNYNKNNFLKLIKFDKVLGNIVPPQNNSNILKAYNHFRKIIIEYAENECTDKQEQLKKIFRLLYKVNATRIVRIIAASRSSANVLFEALNNRGMTLTITDLIKNQLLSALEIADKENVENHIVNWNFITKIFEIDDKKISAKDQERFFRQSYDACRMDWGKDFIPGKHSNILKMYENMIKKAPLRVCSQLMENSVLYRRLQGLDDSDAIKNSYADLQRIKGATSYTLLLYLLRNKEALQLNNFKNICKLLVNFFVRYSFTGNPPSNELERIFNGVIDEIIEKNLKGNDIYEKLSETLHERYKKSGGGVDNLETMLRGDVYNGTSDDYKVRFVLSQIAEKDLGVKTQIDFWAESDKRAGKAWTIEHILPQKKAAEENLTKHVHKIGNLTLTQYNSEMKDKSFKEKLKWYRKDNLNDGLNKEVVNQTEWTPAQIETRTDSLVKEILDLFKW